MKNLKLLIATLLSLQFASPAYSNNSVAVESELKESVLKAQLTLKSEELKSLLHEKWVIENMYENSAEGIYINHHDNPALSAAIAVLGTIGLVSLVQISDENELVHPKRKYSYKENLIGLLKSMKEYPTHAGLMVVAFGYMGAVIVTQGSNTASLRRKFENMSSNGTLTDYHKEIELKIKTKSQEILILKKTLSN